MDGRLRSSIKPSNIVIIIEVTYNTVYPSIEVTYDTTSVDIISTLSASPVTIEIDYSSVTSADLSLKVPYTGATGNVDLGEFGLTAGFLQVDTTPTNTPNEQGTMYWDDNAETVALIMNGTIQKIGEDVFFHVQNRSGSSIPKGTCVRFDGTDGNSGKLLIAPFIANGTYPSQYFMGVTAETIANGGLGKVYHFGKMRGINTNAFNEGDILYASTSVAGGFQTAVPTAPNNIIIAAAVVSKANNGTIMVRSTLGSNINNDEGVRIVNPMNGDILAYNATSGLWENISAGGGITSLNGLTPSVQTFATGNSGTDFNISSATSTHTFNIPTASATNRGLLSSADWSAFDGKQPQLNGTGFVKATGTTISYDNTTYYPASNPSNFIDLTDLSAGTGISYDNTTGVITNAAPDQTVSLTGTGTTSISGTYPSFTINSADQYVGTVTSVDLASGTGISVSGGPITTNGSITVTNTAPDQVVSLTGAGTTSISGTYPNFTVTSNDQYVGTVTSVDASVPTGFAISGNPVTSSGTLAIGFAAGYSLPTDLRQGEWDTAYTNRITSLTTSGDNGAATLVSNTLNIPNYSLSGLGGVPSTRTLTINGTGYDLSADRSWSVGTITSLTGEATASGTGAVSVTLDNASVIGKVLTGLNLTGGGTIAATDSILQAFGKVQNQISAMVGGVIFQGVWNASTNTPTLTSSTGTKGYYYIVDTNGTTNLDGITDWKVGDWAIFNGATWDKVDNTDAVSSVNGYTGAVSLSTTDVGEGTNLYFTNTRAQNAITLTTSGTSGAATYTSGTLNIPAYSLSGLGGVPSSRTLTINGTTYDLTADRTWSVGTVTSVAALTLGTTGTDVSSTVANGTTTPVITLNIPTASATNRGALSSADWATFNSKQPAGNYVTTDTTQTITGSKTFAFPVDISANGNLRFEQSGGFSVGPSNYSVMDAITTGFNYSITDSGSSYKYFRFEASGLTNNTLRTYTLPDVSGTITLGTGTTNYLPKFTGASTIGDSAVSDNGTTVTLHSRALSGTSATFSSSVTAGGQITMAYGGNPRLLLRDTDAGAGNVGILFREDTNDKWTLASVGGAFQFFNEATASNALYITSGNNVGIGTTSPAYKLDVADSGAIVARLNQINVSAAADNGPCLAFQLTQPNTQTTQLALIKAGNNEDWKGYLAFYTQSSTDPSNTTSEKMRITSGGNLLLGSTTDNGAKFQVTGAATFSSSVTAGGGLFSGNISSLTYEASSAGAIQPGTSEFISTGFNLANSGSQDISTISLPSNTQWKAIITGAFANNNEGGGLVSPTFSRDIDGTNNTIAAGSTTITFSRNASTGKLQATNNLASARVTFVGTIHLVTFPQSSIPPNSRAFFGNVGIGTPSPNSLLHLLGGILKVEATSSSAAYLQLSYNGATNGQSGYIGYDPSANMTFFTNNTERMRITSGGAVEMTGTVKTGNPSGDTAKPWKLGQAASGGAPTTTHYISVEIDGTTYYLAAGTTPP
jgi:predicted heme/steroid binding protein